jgi:hypothetical protein
MRVSASRSHAQRGRMRYRVVLGKNARDAPPQWLMVSRLEEYPAMYPYAQLRNILKPEDVPSAIADECAPLEQEFGGEALRPFYHLLWLLNTLPSLYTFQTQVAPRDLKPPYAWARTQVASQIIVLPRDPTTHTDQRSVEAINSWWLRSISQCASQRTPNSTGWMISVGPTPVRLLRLRIADAPDQYRDEDLIEMPGFGSVLRFHGCANSRLQAAERWKAAVKFVAEIIEEEQSQNRLGRAEPHRHIYDSPIAAT